MEFLVPSAPDRQQLLVASQIKPEHSNVTIAPSRHLSDVICIPLVCTFCRPTKACISLCNFCDLLQLRDAYQRPCICWQLHKGTFDKARLTMMHCRRCKANLCEWFVQLLWLHDPLLLMLMLQHALSCMKSTPLHASPRSLLAQGSLPGLSPVKMPAQLARRLAYEDAQRACISGTTISGQNNGVHSPQKRACCCLSSIPLYSAAQT